LTEIQEDATPMITLPSTASQTPNLTLSFANPPSGTEQLPQAFGNTLTEMLERKPVEEELAADPAAIPTPPILVTDITSTIGTVVAYTGTPEATDAINQPGANTTVDELLDNLSTGTPLVNAGKAAPVEPILTGEQYWSTDATEPTPPIVGDQPFSVLEHPSESDQAIPPVTDKLAAAVNLPNSQPFSTSLQTEGQLRPVQTHPQTSAGTFSNPVVDTATNTASEIPISVTPNMESGETQSASENNPSQISSPAIFAESGKSLPHPVAAITLASHSATASILEGAANSTSTLATPFQQSDWSDTFSQRITWLATQQIQAAELKLNPAHLGPIEISLKLNGDQQLIAQFVSHHPAVREAIEANLPKLREIMAENGITLADTSVSADTPQQQAENGQNGSHPRRPATGNYFSYDSADPGTSSPLPATRHTGLIDTFA